ncbi:MAG TPA: Omp28-related outer membrane protein [Flavobacteriaceae bacterium]|nr:Omp28-related outer membrane protein [Flavobacteriaceae bacterium]
MACSSDDSGDGEEITSISVSSSSTLILGGTATFTVTTNTGDDVTSSSEIFVDGTALTDNTFTPTAEGMYEITAQYADLTSAVFELTVVADGQLFPKRVLIEDFTGTWCGNCPKVANAIDMVQAQSDNVVVVAVHQADGSQPDPYDFPEDILDPPGVTQGLPQARLNRNVVWPFVNAPDLDLALNLTGDDATVGLAIDSEVTSGNLNVSVDVKFGLDHSGENLKLVVYVLENGLIHNQVNYTTYYGGNDPIVDFEHNHVLRASLTDLHGNSIPDAQTASGNVYNKTFNVAVPSSVENAANISIAAFVVGADGTAVNSRDAQVGMDQEFQEL